MRVYLTGGSGFVGSNVTRVFTERHEFGVYHYADWGLTTPLEIAEFAQRRLGGELGAVHYEPLLLPARRPNAVELLTGKEPMRREFWADNLDKFLATYEE